MSQEIDSSDESAADKVFRMEELREEILKYAMYDNLGKLSGKMVGAVRVVQRTWLQSTTRLLRKSKESVIKLTFDVNICLRLAQDVKIKGLVETFGASPRLQESFLPMKLDVIWRAFHERNYQSLSDCLTRLGNELVEIHLDYPKDGGTMPVTFPPFSLPQLRKLSFEFSGVGLQKDERDDEDVFGNNQNGLGLLQTILISSNAITDLIIPFAGIDVVPVGFKYLQLPVTISFLDIGAKLKSKDLEVLLRNRLPNLSYLTLMVHDVPFQDGLLFHILERFQTSLQTLEINGFQSNGRAKPHTHLRFPLVENLKKIEITCTECELGPEEISTLQTSLPKLAVVKLVDQPEASLAKWTQDSRFENVEELAVSVVNEQLNSHDASFFMSPPGPTMAQLQQTFPNVRSLSLTVNVSDLISLRYVFQDMAQLKTLRICFSGDGAVLDVSSDLIDATLLGLPLKLVVALKEEIQLLDTDKIIIKVGGEPSIRNLSELIALTLETDRTENGTSLMSDLLFGQAFMKMATLRKLDLHDKFKPSLEIADEWNGHGRTIKYSQL